MMTDISSSRLNRSQTRKAVAPGVMTIATTRKAPTVCIATTMATDNTTRNSILISRTGMPIVPAWHSSKNTSKRSRHKQARVSEQAAVSAASCRASAGEIARMLPNTMVWTGTGIGLILAINRPVPRKLTNIRPRATSFLSSFCVLK